MADVDWGVSAELQEKSLRALDKLSLENSHITAPIPAPQQPNEADTGEDDEPELNAADISYMKKLVRSHLVETKSDLQIQRKDPNSPLFSAKTFEELKMHPDLLRGVYGMGFNRPSKIQETALPMLIADPPVNMIAQSQSGTGKTAAFVLAALSRVDPSLDYPHVLVLSPTYELAVQTGEVAKKMAQYTGIQFRFAIRGENLDRGHRITEPFLIGTPGKIFDWAMRYKFFNLKKMKVFVLDEADVMVCTQGFEDQSIRIHQQLPPTCQMMLFSATYSDEVMKFAEHIVPDPVIIRLKKEEESLDNIKQFYVVSRTPEEKFQALCNVYGGVSIGQSMIFCRTKKTASWLAGKMKKDGHNVALLSGDLTVEQRIAVLNRFRDGKEKVLITTNVCARGIDIEQVTVVINFDIPVNQHNQGDFETYLHRIGRTGRFGKKGLAINMIANDQDMGVLKSIEEHFGKKISQLETDDIDALERLES